MLLHPTALCALGLAILAAPAAADIAFTKPAAGDRLRAGSTIEVRWRDTGSQPTMADMQSYRLTLCAGGNEDGQSIELMTIVNSGHFDVGSVAQAFVPATIGRSTGNGYFVKMAVKVPGQGTLTRFSHRFGYSDMAGNFPPDIDAAIRDLPAGFRPPPPADYLSLPGQAAAGLDPDAGPAMFRVPYAEQRGRTRYAPMQVVPPTKISALSPTPLHPTSPLSIALSRLPPATTIDTTVTESRSSSADLVENGAAAWPGPGSDQAARDRYRERWGLEL